MQAEEFLYQNLEVLNKMAKYTGISSECVVPTMRTERVSAAKRPPVIAQVVIGTPGTIKKCMSLKKLSTNFMKILVFDEADCKFVELHLHVLANDPDSFFGAYRQNLKGDMDVINKQNTSPVDVATRDRLAPELETNVLQQEILELGKQDFTEPYTHGVIHNRSKGGTLGSSCTDSNKTFVAGFTILGGYKRDEVAF